LGTKENVTKTLKIELKTEKNKEKMYAKLKAFEHD
jgi:hypothetical protein